MAILPFFSIQGAKLASYTAAGGLKQISIRFLQGKVFAAIYQTETYWKIFSVPTSILAHHSTSASLRCLSQSKQVKQWNFRKAKWNRYRTVTNESIKSSPRTGTSDADAA